MDPHERSAVIDCARTALEGDPRILTAYLFGSFARGTATKDSDIDIGVLFAERIPPAIDGPLAQLRDAVERACHRPCDIIDMRAAPADLVHRVLRDGELLIERDSSARCEFEVARRNEYFDLLPYLLEYRRMAAR
jgi:uncharacterized protein